MTADRQQDSEAEHRPAADMGADRHGQAFRPGTARRHSVFGSPRDADKLVGTVPCPNCEAEIAYRLRSVGELVHCPHCKRANVRIGSTLLEPARQQDDTDDAPPPAVMVFPRARGRFRLLVLAPMLVVALLVASDWFTSARVIITYKRWLGLDTVSTRLSEAEGTPRVGTFTEEHLPPPPEEITLEAIEQLLRIENPREALVQAQLWQQLLRDFRVPESDPRLQRLAAIIKELSRQLTPESPSPPAFLEEFRQALQQLRTALISEDLSAARNALRRAEDVFNAHAEELAHFGRSLLALRQRLARLELLHEGQQQVRDLLERAAYLIRQGSATKAAETIARAKFLALRTPMEDAEFEQRSKTARQLEKELRFVRGQRAVRDAEKCHEQKDAEARDVQLRVAFDLLPDFPASRVQSLLARAKELYNEKIDEPSASQLGSELDFRSAYEEALQFYGRINTLVELAHACVEAHQRALAADHLDEEHDRKVAKLILGALEFAVGDLLSRPNTATDVAPGLALARTALEKASPWKGNRDWQLLNDTILTKGNEVAGAAIKRAQEDAAQGRLDLALRIIEPALILGQSHVQEQARQLVKQWQNEVERRDYLAAQEELWSQVAQLARQKQYLDTWRALNLFEQKFPDSPRKQRVGQARQKIRPAVDKEVAQVVDEIRKHYSGKDWPKLREAYQRLEGVPLSGNYRRGYDRIAEELAGLNEKADELFQSLKRQWLMASNDDVIELLETLPKVLRMTPEHSKAARLLRRARDAGRRRAQALLMRAKLSKSANPTLYRERLMKVVRLDPNGPRGTEAQKLLANL